MRFSTMSRLDKTKCVTLEWKIVNFSHFLPGGKLCGVGGHVFKSETPEETTWWSTGISQSVSLEDSPHPEYKINFQLRKITGENRGYQCELLLFTTNGEIQVLPPIYTGVYSGDGFCFEVKPDKIFGNSEILPEDTLTVCYRIWKNGMINLQNYEFHTVLNKVDFIWDIKGFKFDKYYNQSTLHQQDSLQLISHLFCNEDDNHRVLFTIQPNVDGFPHIVNANLSIQEDHGKCLDQNKDHNCSKSVWNIKIYERADVSKNLQIRIKSVIAMSKECPAFSNDSIRPGLEQNISKTDFRSLSNLGSDLLLLYKNKLNSDAIIKVDGKSFPVHKNILSARSQVFRSKLERNPTTLAVEDVDCATLERLLVFLYSGTLEDLQWELAIELYRAASKYAVPSLKRRCADILKEHLVVSNVCEVLEFADGNADEVLMRYAVDFIQDHMEVVSSPKWGKLEDRNPRLAAKITRELCLKNVGK